MTGMTNGRTIARSGWYRSFYWRIGLGFVVSIIGVLVAQSLVFSYMVARSSMTLPGGLAQSFAASVAGDVAIALRDNPQLDLQAYLQRQYGHVLFPVHVVLKDGRVASNGPGGIPEPDRRAAEAVLSGRPMAATLPGPGRKGPPGALFSGDGRGGMPAPTVAHVKVADVLVGVVIVPSPRGPDLWRDVGRVLSGPGLAVLVVATVLVALLIFAPARRRLRALELATEKLGAGDLTARAPENGGDEIARVASAFNRMAAELAARDEAVRTSDRLRRQMLADVSHELNTPLTSMRGYLETLHMPEVALDTATRERYVETVERETRRLERIVKDLLDLARYENGAVALDVRTFATGRIFEHVMRRHEHEAHARQVVIRVDVNEQADQMTGDPDRIEQVIENLVANALRHTPGGGTIDLRAAPDEHGIRLTVTDSGEGIPADHLAHVFDRFYKADAARAAAAGGSGLGLSIVKAIVERHDGTIRVTSVPGRTEFTIVLPAAS